MKSKEDKNAYDSLVAFINRHNISVMEEQRLRQIIKEIKADDAKCEAITFHQWIQVFGERFYKTTEQLYNLYLESKKQKV